MKGDRSDPDDWVPASRVRETAAALAARGAHVTTQVFPGLGHEVNEAELSAAGQLIVEAQPGTTRAEVPTPGPPPGEPGVV